MEMLKSSRIIDTAKREVTDFRSMFERLEQKAILGGLSNSTLLNYGRCIAKISLHFKCIPTQLDEEQINGYLQHLLVGQKPSRPYFKHTVYGLRFLFRIYDLEDRIIKLPSLKRDNKLPVVLSPKECKQLFAAGRILKHEIHLVFTLPHQLNELCLAFPRQLYALLMKTAWHAIQSFGWNHKYLGAQIGTTMVLHTWGSNLSFHPHVHCIVPGGGITIRGKWKNAKGNRKFLFPVHALSKKFKGQFLHQLGHFFKLHGLDNTESN